VPLTKLKCQETCRTTIDKGYAAEIERAVSHSMYMRSYIVANAKGIIFLFIYRKLICISRMAKDLILGWPNYLLKSKYIQSCRIDVCGY
jgi:hypothetical protein